MRAHRFGRRLDGCEHARRVADRAHLERDRTTVLPSVEDSDQVSAAAAAFGEGLTRDAWRPGDGAGLGCCWCRLPRGRTSDVVTVVVSVTPVWGGRRTCCCCGRNHDARCRHAQTEHAREDPSPHACPLSCRWPSALIACLGTVRKGSRIA